MALVGEANERPRWVPDPTSASMRFDEERRRKEEEAKKEEERKQRAIAAAQAMAAHRAEEQRTTNKSRVSTDVSLTSPRVDTGTPSLSASGTYQSPLTTPDQPTEAPAVSVRPQQQDWRRGYAAPSVAPGMAVMPDQTAGIRALGAALPALAPVVGQGLAGVGQALGSAGQAIGDWWNQDADKMQFAGEMYGQRKEQLGQAMRSFALPETAANAIPGGLGHLYNASVNWGAPALLPAFDVGYQLAGQADFGTGTTAGQAVSAAGEAFGQMSADLAKAKTAASSDQDTSSPQGYLEAVQQNAGILFDGFSDYAQYYMDGLDAWKAALTPTPEQTLRTTPEDVKEARLMGQFLGYSGVNAAAEAFDEILDNPILGQQQLVQAEQLAAQAQQMPEGPEREAALVQAAQLGAEAVRLRDKTLLEVYDDNQIWWRELAAGFIFDPLEAIGLVGEIGKIVGFLPQGITPMGRRTAKALKLTELPENAPLGSTQGISEQIVNRAAEYMKVGTSKAKSDSVWLWEGLNRLVSNISVKEDVITVFGDLINNAQRLAEQGVEVSRLVSPEAASQLNPQGFMRFGWAGIKNTEFQNAMRVIKQPGFLDAVSTLPSMRASQAGEVLDKAQFQADLHGLLGRWSGWYHKVSAMDGVPYAAKTATLVPSPTTPGMFAVEFYDGKTLLTRTTDMAQADAQVALKNAEWGIKRGEEYRRNPLTMIADWQRQLFSATALNANPSSIIRNILGGMGMGIVNLEDPRVFQKLSDSLNYVLAKNGGMFPDLRVATGAGELPGPSGINVTSAGYWKGSDFVNRLLLGIPEKGRQFRNWSEEAMASLVYATGFRQGVEKGAKLIELDIAKLVGEFIPDAKQAKPIVEQLVQVVISGGRSDLAKAAADIAAGAPNISLRGISPALVEVLESAQVLEVDNLLRTLTPANLPAAMQRIDDIFQQQMGLAVTAIGELGTPKRFYWSVADRVRDRSEWFDQLQRGLKSKRLDQTQFDALKPIVKQADQIATQVDEALLSFLQASNGRPDTLPVVYGTFLRTQDVMTNLRRQQSDLVRVVTDELERMKNLGATPEFLSSETGRLWTAYYDAYTQAVAVAQRTKLQIVTDMSRALADGSYRAVPQAVSAVPPWNGTGVFRGWKLHLGTGNPTEVSRVLDGLGVRYKVGRSGGQPGKDITVYIGHKDTATQIAGEIEKQAGQFLNPASGDVLKDDMQFVGKVWGRFDSPNAANLPSFHQYGRGGVPYLAADQPAVLQGAMTPQVAMQRAKAELERAFGALYTGTGTALPGQNDIRQLFTTLGTNVQDVLDLQDLRLAFSSDDPALFARLVQEQWAVTDKFTAQMFTAFQRFPTMDNMDEYMSAIADMNRWTAGASGRVRAAWAPIKALQDQGVLPARIPKALWDAARDSRRSYATALQRGWERMQAATARMLEKSLLDEVTAPLRFNLPGIQGDYRLVGQSGQKGRWIVINETTGRMLHLKDSGRYAVPKQAIAALPAVKKAAEIALAEQIGTLARQAGITGVGIPEIDQMIDAVTKSPLGTVYNQIKMNVAEHIANARPSVVVPSHMEDFVLDSLGAAQASLKQIMPQVAQMNAKGLTGLGPQFVQRFNGEILPRLDNLLTGADRVGKAAVSTSLVDYYNNYWPDVIMSLFAPYHFWFSRMAKNSLEQAITNPRITANLTRLYNKTFAENQKEDVPNRNMFQIPGYGFDLGNTHVQFDLPFATWLPIFPLFVQYGWADPNRINAATEFLSDNMEEAANPGSKNGVLGNTLVAIELAKRFGVGVYPWQDAAVSKLAGMRVEESIGSLGPIPRMLGNGGVLFGQWLGQQGAPELGKAAQALTAPLRPFYEPYLVGREGSLMAARGEITDVQAQNLQDVGYQRFFPGQEPLPEQLPEAESLYEQARGAVSQDYLLRQFLGWLFPARFTANYEGEATLNQATEMRRDMGYEPGLNTAGAKEAQIAMYDLTPGLSAKSSQYAVTGESAPQVPDPNAVRPGARAAQGAYFDKSDEIYARYAALIEAEYGKHPEWNTPGTGTARYEILNPIYEQREAELAALKEQYPTVQEMERQPANTPSKLSGTNPGEAVGILMTVIVAQAKETLKALDPGPRPENASRSDNASWQDKKNQYDAALTAEVNRLMQQPDIGQLVPGRELPGAGVQAESGSLPPIQGPQYRQPGAELSQISQTQQAQGIENPWSAEMAAAEQQYGLKPGLLSHIAQAESGFDPSAKSGAGAIGLMQFMPATWSDAEKALGLTDINDPAQQVQAAAWYLDWLSKQLPPGKNGLDWQLAAYNLGIGKVSQLDSLDQLPGETSGYVNAILGGVGGSVVPARSPYTPGGTQTQAFGNESDYYTQMGFAGHEGVDYGMPEGTPVTAAASGTVVFAGEAPPNNAAYGNYIIVRHADGKETWYAHLSGWDVKAGDTVTAGQQIGLSGNTGTSTGPHLHFAVRDPNNKGDPMKGFIDPATYLAGMEQGLPTPVGINLTAPSPAQGQPAPSPSNNIQFPKSAEQLIGGAGDQYKGPLQLQSEAGLAQGQLAQATGLAEAYPEYVALRAEWDRTNDEDRDAFRLAHPEITAVNLLLWNKDVWTEVEGTFGQGAVLKYARRPTYESGQRPAYYHKDPTSFLVGAWLNGRPEPKKEEGQQDTDFSYDRGADYTKAEELFGAGIWGKVRSYWAIDPADKAARNQFFKDNPDYKAWNDWWYALMPDQKPAGYAGYYLGGGSGYGNFEQQDMPGQAKQSWRRNYPSPEVPVYPTGGGIGSDWRKWIDVGSRGWRG